MASAGNTPPEPLAGSAMNWVFPLRLQMGEKLLNSPERMVVKVSPWTLVKGPCQQQELEAMLFISSHTSIPCPRVHRTYRRSNGLFIEMDCIQGSSLESVWDGGQLPDGEKQRIGETIRGYIEQLRALKAPEDFAVGSASGGPVKDGRISTSSYPPFKTTSDFESFLQNGLSAAGQAELSKKQGDSQRTYRSYFSHADICPRNFILQDDGKLVLIDWEFAGWWPEYWEYTKSHFAVFKEHIGWLDLVEKAIPVYSAELERERFLWDDPGDDSDSDSDTPIVS